MANLRIAELDFDTIKTNLKNYLKAQSEFTDYDFEGAGLSVLLDILAYNTHYNAYLANMLVNEMFLDSAVKRSSAVSIAKHLGYTPRSTTGSVAFVNVTVNNPTGSPTALTMERYTPFTTTVGGTAYTFLTTTPLTIQPVNGVYTFSNVQLKEGRLLEYSFTVVNPGPDEKYEVPNPGIDTSTMQVTVQTSSTDTTLTTYTLADDTTDISSSSTVYYLEENTLGNYQLYFGDGVLGKKLSAGNIIRVRYLACAGTAANTSGSITQSFSASEAIGGSGNITVTTVTNSTGGADKESIDSIKFNAPKTNLARKRAVTSDDYSSLIKARYSQVESIAVWGGEENEPPVYGKVFISLKPFEGFTIDNVVKDDIKNTILKDRQILTVTPEFTDPDFIFVNINADVVYNQNRTSLTSSQIKTLAQTAITNYFTNNVQKFERPFYHSQLVEALNNIEPSVENVLVTLKVQKRIAPALNITNAYIGNDTLKFNNRLHPYGLSSTRFNIAREGEIISVRIKDVPDTTGTASYNGTGVIKLYNVADNTELSSIGTINYPNGTITISALTPVGYPAGQFDIRLTCEVQESSYNISAARNEIIVADDSTESTTANREAGTVITVSTLL